MTLNDESLRGLLRKAIERGFTLHYENEKLKEEIEELRGEVQNLEELLMEARAIE